MAFQELEMKLIRVAEDRGVLKKSSEAMLYNAHGNIERSLDVAETLEERKSYVGQAICALLLWCVKEEVSFEGLIEDVLNSQKAQ